MNGTSSVFLATCLAAGVLGCLVTYRAFQGLSGWAKQRELASRVDHAEKITAVPQIQRLAAYAAFVVLIASILLVRWSRALGWGWTGQQVFIGTGVAAVAYLVWFSLRWRHLR